MRALVLSMVFLPVYINQLAMARETIENNNNHVIFRCITMLRFKFDLMGLNHSGQDPAWRLHNNAVSPYLLLLPHKLIQVMPGLSELKQKK